MTFAAIPFIKKLYDVLSADANNKILIERNIELKQNNVTLKEEIIVLSKELKRLRAKIRKYEKPT